MCELATICLAATFTAVWALRRRRGIEDSAAFTTMLMFWGAALMWGVDCTANCLEGEPFFDISKEDTVLALITSASGILVYLVLAALQRLSSLKHAIQRKAK